MTLARSSLVALCALTLACGDAEPRLRVVTDSAAFNRAGTGIVPQAYVTYTVTNDGDRTAFIDACGGNPLATVDRGTGTTWERYTGSGCVADLQPALVLRPGQSAPGYFVFYEAGHYRIRFPYKAGESPSVTPEFAASNPFDVR